LANCRVENDQIRCQAARDLWIFVGIDKRLSSLKEASISKLDDLLISSITNEDNFVTLEMVCRTAAFLVKDPLGKELVGLKAHVLDWWVRLGFTRTPRYDFIAFVLAGSSLRVLSETMDEGLRGCITEGLSRACLHYVTSSSAGIKIRFEAVRTSLEIVCYLSSIETLDADVMLFRKVLVMLNQLVQDEEYEDISVEVLQYMWIIKFASPQLVDAVGRDLLDNVLSFLESDGHKHLMVPLLELVLVIVDKRVVVWATEETERLIRRIFKMLTFGLDLSYAVTCLSRIVCAYRGDVTIDNYPNLDQFRLRLEGIADFSDRQQMQVSYILTLNQIF
jgi:hypothetical protein